MIIFQGTYSASNDFELVNGQDAVIKFNGGGSGATVTQVFNNLAATTVTASFVGNITGNVTGAVGGNVTGNVTGNVSGNVTGDLTGDVSGNVTSTGSSSFSSIDVNGGTIAGTPGAGTFNALATTGDNIRIDTSQTPASSSASGTKGEFAYDTSYIYVCVATNTWKRVALSTF